MHVGLASVFQNPHKERTDLEVYTQELRLADLADPLGFESVWGVEHHFTDYTMCPDVLQFLTYMAGRSPRLQLGSMVVVLPWHDPMRVAEEVSMLDNISGGRLILGLGRGAGKVEFDGFRQSMDDSRQRFVESAEMLLRGLETGSCEYDGRFVKQPRAAIRPAPFKSFRGRTYAAAVSPDSMPVVAKLGIGILVIPQKPWKEVAAELDAYRGIYREVNGAEAPKPLLVTFTAVHESEDGAGEMYERYIMGYCRSALEHYEFANAHLAAIPGYEYYGKLAANLAAHGAEPFLRFLADLQVWGTPARVTEQIVENIRCIDGAGVICVFSYGGMPHDVAKANIRLFAERVLPTLRARDVGAEVGEVPAAA
jgi:alkanesulfonate monooxygenase SsuD/methylene tetrahydromethanopterin reductase-like flavin-dependent oxidoreductase (luciferase family)